MYKIHIPEECDYDELTNIWEDSVRATHTFLSEEDILFFKPLVRKKYLKGSDLYCLKNDGGVIVAFMGISGDMLDMLFIRPGQRAKGLGKFLVNHAINELNVDSVDVNEQNEQAAGFYLHLGFEIESRDEYDSMGKPFPILHLKLKKPENRV